jgi:Arc/MetJ-type ribon-helix-helix transcriptional regulator
MASQVSGVRLADRLEKEIEELVDAGFYVSASEFIREAVREKLQATARRLPDELAEQEILWFLKEKKKSGQLKISIIEIMQELLLPADQIDRIMSRLKGVKEI